MERSGVSLLKSCCVLVNGVGLLLVCADENDTVFHVLSGF